MSKWKECSEIWGNLVKVWLSLYDGSRQYLFQLFVISRFWPRMLYLQSLNTSVAQCLVSFLFLQIIWYRIRRYLEEFFLTSWFPQILITIIFQPMGSVSRVQVTRKSHVNRYVEFLTYIKLDRFFFFSGFGFYRRQICKRSTSGYSFGP